MNFKLFRKAKNVIPNPNPSIDTPKEPAKAPEGRRCPSCRQPVDTTKFKTRDEWAEYNMSGLCAGCQEALYGPAFCETSSPRGPEKI
jgi:hypothetical protein